MAGDGGWDAWGKGNLGFAAQAGYKGKGKGYEDEVEVPVVGKGRGQQDGPVLGKGKGGGKYRVINGRTVYGQNAIQPGFGQGQMAGGLNAQQRRLETRAQVFALCYYVCYARC